MTNITDVRDAEVLIQQAEAETGLGDWGTLPFRESLDRLIDSIRTESRLRPDAAHRMEAGIVGSLKTRLQTQHEHTAHPELGARPIARPIIILGLPRSGTTNLHSLLAQDPAHRVPRTWEVLAPFPAVKSEEYWTDPRIDVIQQSIGNRGMLSDEIQAVLPYHATSPAECGAILDHAFMSQYRSASARLPTWSYWRDREGDWDAAFEFHRQFLQHLQRNYAADRWLLKSPEHLIPAEALAAAYPDAIIIQTHRDPAKVMGSVSSLITALRRLNSDHVDPVEVGREQLDLWHFGTEQMMAARKRWGAGRQVIDVYLRDVARAPIETAADIYRQMDLPFTDEARQAMERFVTGDESAHEKKHNYRSNYDLRDFGLSEDEVRERFASYMQEYGIEPNS